MATGLTPMNVLLAIFSKKTVSVDLKSPLRRYIVAHYSEREAKDADDDLEAINKLREDITKQSDALEARKDNLQRYIRYLTLVESRFPVSEDRGSVSIQFTWYDAFKSSKRSTQCSIHFEKASVAFNLAATYSQLGLSADRSSEDGVRKAARYFQLSAGVFAYLRDHLSLKAIGGGSNSSVDLSKECAGMLEKLMLAQAQECTFEKAAASNMSNSSLAKLAKQVAVFYEEAFASLSSPPLTSHFERNWVIHLQLKAGQYQAEAYLRAAMDLHQQENIGEEIARLKAAGSVVQLAKKAGRGSGSGLDPFPRLEALIAEGLRIAERENDKVYLMRVPSNDSLPPVTATCVVQPVAPNAELDASGEKLLSGLIPESSMKLLSKYTEMVDTLIRSAAERLQAESELAKVKLAGLDIPAALQSLEGSASLPESLRDDVVAVQVDGGPRGLGSELLQLKDLRRVNEELLVQCEQLLDKEAKEDAGIRTQMGTRWTRPASSTLTRTLRDRITSFAGNLRQAAESDNRIEHSIRDNEQLISILNTQPIEAALPPLSKPIISVHGNEDAIVTQLKQLLADLEKLASERAGLEDVLKETKQNDNILPLLMNSTTSPDELFKEQVAKYDPICARVDDNIAAQNLLLEQIESQNEIFKAAFGLVEHKVAKEKVFDRISAAITKYREIRENLNEGLKFYITLQDAITNLKQQCGDYVMTRSIQCGEMMTELQRQIANLSFSAPPPQEQQRQSGPGGFFRNLLNPQQQQQQHQAPVPPAPVQSTPHVAYHQPPPGGYAAPPPGYYSGPPAAPPPGGQWVQGQAPIPGTYQYNPSQGNANHYQYDPATGQYR